MNKKSQVIRQVFFDFLAATVAWGLFYFYRKRVIEPTKFGYEVPFEFDDRFITGIVLLPLLWLLIYALTGAYSNIYRKSRLKEFGQTLYISILGVLVIFFVVILDDEVVSYKTYYSSFLTLFGLHFGLTITFRLILATITNSKIQNKQIGFNTLLIGSNQNALSLYNEMENMDTKQGNLFSGYIHVDGRNGTMLSNHMPNLGGIESLQKVIQEHKIEEVIIAIESSEHEFLGQIINELESHEVIIKIIPDMYDILSGSVKMEAIFGAPLIEINPELMPVWQQSVKRILDIVVSLTVLILFSPLFIVTALAVKFTSKGPIIYSQERIGWHGNPFKIFKFRSMFMGAESNGPMLSSKSDSRITPFGKFIRKIRLDEIPQFVNVLIGDMSLVGPRPERQFFIDKIVAVAPHYRHLHKVRPGITSWGQVKYGYAENVDQMVSRLKYDLIYIENMSLALDLKILIYTILIVVQQRGK